MQNEEQQLIASLFSRLKQAEASTAPRDSEAEKFIQQQLQQQPAAPYYMAQAILIQEAAMKQLNSRVSELEARLKKAPQQSSGGFLSGLFGGGSHQSQPETSSGWNRASAPQQQQAPQGYNPGAAAAPAAGRGFLGGALQTAVGVAGGVVMADMLTSMFHHSQPEEIVNIINEPAMPEQGFDNNQDIFNGSNDNGVFPGQDQGNSASDYNDFSNDGFDDDMNDDSFL